MYTKCLLFNGSERYTFSNSLCIICRAAWYSTIGRIIERYKCEFAAQYGQKTLRILIGAKETSLFAAAQLWDALLLFMHNVEVSLYESQRAVEYRAATGGRCWLFCA